MTFHRNDEPGKKIALSEAEELIEKNLINLGDDGKMSLWGFFSAEILNNILKEPDCVGIRLYNAAFFFNELLIIVGVKADGSEIQESSDGASGYIVSSVRLNDQSVKTFEFTRADRITAAQSVWNAWGKSDQTGGEDIAFASYFSAQTVSTLLHTDDCNGINFYVVGLLKNGKFPFTHMAVAVKNIDFEQHELRGKGNGCIICPDPCPPRCAPEEPIGNKVQDRALMESELSAAIQSLEASEDVTINEIAGTKYLIAWQ